MTRFFGLMFCALLLVSALRAQFADNNFIDEFVYAGNGVVSIDFLPDGTLIGGEKRGILFALPPDGNDGFQSAEQLLDLSGSVLSNGESGLLGLVVDPDFATTGHIFLLYSTSNDQRLVRVTYTGTAPIDPGTETVILSGLPRSTFIHKGGDIEFHPNDNDNIYISLGDDGVGGGTTGGGALIVQDPDRYEGKILKINKSTGLGLVDNSFYQGDTSAVRARVWAVGLRNPFRITFHPDAPVDDVIYISDNGEASQDRLSWVAKGSNGEYDGSGSLSSPFYNPTDPNHRVLTSANPSRVGIVIASGSPFAVDGIPTLYNSKWYPGTPVIERWQLSGSDSDVLQTVASDGGDPFFQGTVYVDLDFGPDGHLYGTQTGGEDAVGYFEIRRVRYIGGTAPTAAFTTNPSPAEGQAPLMVQFTDQSVSGSEPITSWSWDFGNGDTSTQQNPQYTFNDAGDYTVTLQVTQSDLLNDSASTVVRIQNLTTVQLSGTVYDGRDPSSVTPLSSATTLGFYQADGTTPIAVSGGSGAQGNFVDVAAGGTFDVTVDLDLSGESFVVSAGEAASDGVSEAFAGFEVQLARGLNDFSIDFYLAPSMLTGRIIDMRDVPVSVDFGVATDQSGTPLAIAGGRDFEPPFQSTGVAHRRESDALGYFHMAFPDVQVGNVLFFDIVGDTGNDTHPSRSASLVPQSNNTVAVEWRVGRFAGGLDCEDLSGVPTTQITDYDAQIQTIFSNSCIGCHSSGSGQTGGLILSGNATAALVNVESSFVPGYMLVTPGSLEQSYLFEKINCTDPQTGSPMPPSGQLSQADQALIRDWIMQAGQVDCFDPLVNEATNWPNNDIRDLASFVSNNCL